MEVITKSKNSTSTEIDETGTDMLLARKFEKLLPQV